MKLHLNSPKKELNKAYLKEKVSRNDIELFKNNLTSLLGKINEDESEEHLKNLVSDFLKNTWYKESHEINTKGRNDLVIHTGKTTKDNVGVILEVKKPSNKSEMISPSKPNSKAIHELILYFLRERVEHNNIDIKYLIVTNIYEWYIIDEVWFEKNIYRNSKLKKDYENWKHSGNDTRFFYENIAKPVLESIEEVIPCTHFDIRDYEKNLRNENLKDDNTLIALYKILSPVHLLKQPFANDSNSLDTKFYTELLHLIGLEEVKVKGKKLIKQKAEPDNASLLENTIIKLNDRESLRNVTNLSTFGSDKKEQYLNIALELCITWVNRLLFLKLLEAQLFTYHRGNKDYLFLNSQIIFDFDELSNLFFQVLAEVPKKRYDHLKEKFKKVPYLNSSLFERTALERQSFDISALDNRLELPLHDKSILKKSTNRSKTNKLPVLQYFFEFLDAYDFSSVGSEEIQEENKNLINASVLGLIFEKINGYKDGSYFTPGFVTMYMCKETIREAVLQKFCDVKGWKCKSIEELYDKIEDKKEANLIINKIKICDPAVGSGHFLVSALNEIISVKNDLKILLDRTGKTLRDYNVEVVNDELIITDDDGLLFEYKPKHYESQRVQEALFHEKETIIESCLFGVDINQNSVKICSLRLWIELLKNAYYTEKSDFTELETLPNIDINIKCGNSLIGRFPLDSDLTKALKKNNITIGDYRKAVHTYQNAETKEEKRLMEDLMESIETNFRTEFNQNSREQKQLEKLSSDLYNKYTGQRLFDDQKLSKAQIKDKQDLESKIKKLEVAIEEIKSNKIYENAFEWRFKFPEVLDDEGDFKGFDVIIGNPPWGAEIEKKSLQKIKTDNTDIIVRMVDSFMFFINKSFSLKAKNGFISMIIPDVLLYQVDNTKLREKILNNTQLIEVINLGDNIFQDVARASAIVIIGSDKNYNTRIGNYRKKLGQFLDGISLQTIDTNLYKELPYSLFATDNLEGYNLLTQLGENKLKDYTDGDGIQRGVSPDFKDAFVISDEVVEKFNLEENKIKITVTGGTDVKKYFIADKSKKLIYTSKEQPEEIPNIIKYLKPFENKITCKEVQEGKHPYYSLHRERDEKIFLKKEKIIGVITGDKIIATLDTEQIYPTDGIYLLNANTLADNRFLLAILNSKIATYIYRLFSLEEGRALAQVKPSILKELPVPFVESKNQEPFINLVEYLLFLNNPNNSQLVSHTSNDRIAVNIEDILNMMVYELYFTDHLSENGIDVLQFLKPKSITNLKPVEVEEVIRDFYLWYQKPENAVRQRMLLVETRSKDKIVLINKTIGNE